MSNTTSFPLISHEVPFSLLDESTSFNDYDYCLVHLLENEKYRKFYEKSLIAGRTVILDNSIFELGTAFSIDAFKAELETLSSFTIKPKQLVYIVPDVLDHTDATINNMEEWEERFPKSKDHIGLQRMGVVQGRTYSEMLQCFQHLRPLCDKIGISFNCKAYEEEFDFEEAELSLLEKWMLGRIQFLQELHGAELLKGESDPFIHLLGCSVPQEFIAYFRPLQFGLGTDTVSLETMQKIAPLIYSIDTSNPIVHGYKNIRYAGFLSPRPGLWQKDSTKLADIAHEDVVLSEDIKHNIHLFKMFCGRS